MTTYNAKIVYILQLFYLFFGFPFFIPLEALKRFLKEHILREIHHSIIFNDISVKKSFKTTSSYLWTEYIWALFPNISTTARKKVAYQKCAKIPKEKGRLMIP